MRLWFDEDLSPTLVKLARELGFDATCNRDRGMLGSTDRELRRAVQAEGFVLVTDNLADFRPMYAAAGLHPGLIAVPAAYGRATQRELTRAVLAHIVGVAAQAGEAPADFMVNRLAEIDGRGRCAVHQLPP